MTWASEGARRQSRRRSPLTHSFWASGQQGRRNLTEGTFLSKAAKLICASDPFQLHPDSLKSLRPNLGPDQHIFGLRERLEHTPDANLRLCFSVLSCFTFLYKFSELGWKNCVEKLLSQSRGQKPRSDLTFSKLVIEFFGKSEMGDPYVTCFWEIFCFLS